MVFTTLSHLRCDVRPGGIEPTRQIKHDCQTVCRKELTMTIAQPASRLQLWKHALPGDHAFCKTRIVANPLGSRRQWDALQ